MIGRSGPPWGVLPTFFTSTRAGATAVAGVAVAVAAFLGVGLAGDYLTLTGQRNLLKAAADSGTIAATKHLTHMNLNGVDDETLESTLRLVAERYLLANLPPNKRERARRTLEMTIVPDRALRTVALNANADLGGILFLDGQIGTDTYEFRAATKSDVESDIPSTEVVLAIDTTLSMKKTVDGRLPSVQPDFSDYPSGKYPGTKLYVVTEAAKALVDILSTDEVLTASDGKIAVGLVPWDFRVRLGSAERARWERENWARYPDQRVYPRPYEGAPAGGETAVMPAPAVDDLDDLEGWELQFVLDHDVDDGSWNGCLDYRSLTGSPAPGFAPTPPWDSPFTMSYYTHQWPEGTFKDFTVGFTCRGDQQFICYDPDAGPDALPRYGRQAAQAHCVKESPKWNDFGRPSPVVPLTSDAAALREAISNLTAGGYGTYSARGVVWALRLLDPDWKPAWGDAVHPLDPAKDGKVIKIIVLLTDGEDEYSADAPQHLDIACATAKQAGVRVFVVTAMDTSHSEHTEFARQLERCSSQSDDPEGQYVFINNATPEALRKSFRDITLQIQKLRIIR